jgi:hypothetical protein
MEFRFHSLNKSAYKQNAVITEINLCKIKGENSLSQQYLSIQFIKGDFVGIGFIADKSIPSKNF